MKIDVVLIQEGSPLPESDDIMIDITNFLNTASMTPRLFWFKTKVMKAITNSSWEPWKKKIDDYYTKVNAHDKAMGLWALHYVRSEKMIKMETSKQETDDNVDNSSATDNKRKRKDIGPRIRITAAAISIFSTYLQKIHMLRTKHTNILNLHSENIKQAIRDDRDQKSLNPIEIQEDDEIVDTYVPDANEYMQTPWEV